MFENTMIEILGNNPTIETSLKSITVDLQQYDTAITIENFEFNITKRFYTFRLEKLLLTDGYIRNKDKVFKILKIKEYSDFQEVWLYELQRKVI